ncbi:MAG: beta-lactamase family protein [Methanospirillaceae archaeon]|nr:beta-lactamase family protein [Methanospirillaceae archaeon]
MNRSECISILLAGILIAITGIPAPGSANDTNTAFLTDIPGTCISVDGPGMVVCVTTGGDTMCAVSGLANVSGQVPLIIQDRFRIASATKPYVATLVLQLAEEGLVDIDAPLATYLPADMGSRIPNSASATVRQAMQMRSGIPDYMTDEFYDRVMDNPDHPWTAAEVVTFAYDEPPDCTPGTDFVYSNTNYVLLGILIEQITGNSLAKELQDRIFDPTGMETCYLEDPASIGQGIVRGYSREEDGYREITGENDGVGLGDGGIVGSAKDIAKFLPALMSNAYFSPEMLSQMLSFYPDDEGESYGLGISEKKTQIGNMIGHDGASSGFQSNMYYQPDSQISLVILTNDFDSECIQEVFDETIRLIAD